MGISKTEVFTERQNRAAELAKALAHPARLAILEFLIETKTCITGDIVDYIPLSATTVGQHLKELKRVGLVQGKIQGPGVKYCINPDAWQELKQTLGPILQSYNPLNDNSCEAK